MTKENPFECWKKGCKNKPIGLKQFNPDFWRVYSCKEHAEELDTFQTIKQLFTYWRK